MSHHAFGDGFLNPTPGRFGATESRSTQPGPIRTRGASTRTLVTGGVVAGALAFTAAFASSLDVRDVAPDAHVGTTMAAAPQILHPPEPPSQEELSELGLDDASLDAAWDAVVAEIRAEGGDPDAMARYAGETLSAWREHPYTLDEGFSPGTDKS